MSKKKLIIETSIFSILLVTLYVIFFSLLFSYSKKVTYSYLSDSVKIAENVFNSSFESKETVSEKMNDYYKNTENNEVRISLIIKEEGSFKIIYDSKNMTNLSTDNSELYNLKQYVIRNSSYGDKMIYYTVVSEKQKENYYIRASIKESSVTGISKNFLIIGLPILVSILIIYIIYRIIDYNKSVRPLLNEIKKLNKLSGLELDETKNDIETISLSISKIDEDLSSQMNQLNYEKDKTNVILNSITQGLLVVSKEKKIILYNKAMSEIFSYSEDEVLNKNYHILTSDDSFNNRVDQLIDNKEKVKDFNFNIKNKIYRVSMMITENTNKLDYATIILFIDVSEIENMQNIKNDFFANASHELKTPLTTILGYQELIYNKIITDPKELEEANEKTIKQAKKMRDLLNDMMTISRLENQQERIKEDVDIKSVITEILNELDLEIKKMQLKVVFKAEELIVFANRDDIYKLFKNIIENGIKYNKIDGELNITISSKMKTVTIIDTGIGIRKQDQNRIFERFYRVDNSKSPNSITGTGLGLSIVKHILEEYNYRIELDSIYKVGTTFKVYLK